MRTMFIRPVLAGLLLLLLLTGCAPAASVQQARLLEPVRAAGAAPPAAAEPIKPAGPARQAAGDQPERTAEREPARQASEETAIRPSPLRPTVTATRRPTLTPTALPVMKQRSPSEWKQWPVLPVVDPALRKVYQRGLEQGARPYAFSVLGDCQSQPDVFMGVFDRDINLVRSLPEPLQETVRQFQGSFDRYSPTVKDGTTEGALLWYLWNDNKEKKCTNGESPLDCELRVHRPSIVFVHTGTHWEARNRQYLVTILEKILDAGAVPVLVTKADNRELDERVNRTLAELAYEYNLPLWNFWRSVQHLPNHGMEPGSDMYLSPDGLEIHRMGALQALDAVWRALR